LLVPRMGSTQRAAIVNPANGLMVFDTNQQCFYFYSQSKWSKVSYIGGLWSMNDSLVFLSDTILSLGIGTTNPNGKFEVKADNSQGPDDPLFEVKDKNGDVVFGVYPSGVRVYIEKNFGHS
jgi:trimeric autotransporter adhesin